MRSADGSCAFQDRLGEVSRDRLGDRAIVGALERVAARQPETDLVGGDREPDRSSSRPVPPACPLASRTMKQGYHAMDLVALVHFG
jgi:hypothetical protein